VLGDGFAMNSSYERGKKAEEVGEEWLQKKFGFSFATRSLQVGWKSDGKPAMHNFDLVSDDGHIVAEVKSHQLTKSGKIPSGKISDTYKACLMLEKVSAQKKFLILTDSKFYEIFKRYSDGKISNEIEIVLTAHRSVEEPNSVKNVSQKQIKKSEKTNFDAFWSKLTSWLSNKRHIINWTVDKGEIGENFEALHAGGNYIILYPKSAWVQKVPKKDFKIIYENWNEYLTRVIPRSYFVHGPIAGSRFTKYIISILHQYLSLR